MMEIMRLKRRIILVSWLLILWSSPFSLCHAGLQVKDYKFPTKYVLIKEAFDAGKSVDGSSRVIFCIQDAHCNYEAQKNTAALLDYLVKKYDLRLILVEGGYGYVGLSSLRGYAPLKTRQELAEKYLRQGRISGEEYYDLVSDSDLELYGIDDEALYDAHLEVFWKVDAVRKDGVKQLDKVISVLNRLKPFIYSDELRQLEQKKEAYESKGMKLTDYCAYLASFAAGKSVSLDKYPAITAFLNTVNTERNMDLKAAEAERNIFIKTLAAGMDSEHVKQLVSRTQDFKDGKFSAKDYYSYLRATARPAGIDFKKEYPHLLQYMDYICGADAVNPSRLVNEITALEQGLKEISFVDGDQRELDGISRMARILKHLFGLELTPEEYSYFEANRAEFRLASWENYLKEKCMKYDLPGFTVSVPSVDGNLAVWEEFYKLGAAREHVFMKNLESKMGKSGEKTAVLITGGFHTPGMTRALKHKGYSYIVLAPVITSESDASLYFSVLRDQKEDVNEENDHDEDGSYE